MKNKFNHVTQAWRQPGSSFKPFIYSAALEKGFTPASVVNDAPLFFDAGVTGGQPWEPKNYDGTFDGPMTLRRGLAKSKNMISIRVLQSVGPRNAQDWITHFGFLLQEVTRSGTAARAQATLKRPDVYGKTGTTNDAMDAWFAGYQPSLTAIVWIGYDTPRKLGDRETGGGLSLPIWIRFMETALRNVPVHEPSAPEGLVQVAGEWYYSEHGASGGVRNLGGTSASGKPESEAPAPLPKADERSRIMDLFRN